MFSVLNALPHFNLLVREASVIHGRKLSYHQDSSNYMRYILNTYAVIACIAWMASAIFHARKTNQTSKFDYMTALAFISAGLWVAVQRFLGPHNSVMRATVSLLIFVGLCIREYHMYMGFYTFDGHMQLCITIVVVTVVVWVSWILFVGIKSHRISSQIVIFEEKEHVKHKLFCLACQIYLLLAAALEIFDFPPWLGSFDAHSLWHAATIPLGFAWYKWLDHDIALHVKVARAA